jgi:holo-[acyl-carrier protein] synthase
MILRTGVDMIEIERLRETMERRGEQFMARIFTPAEQAECGSNFQSLAARFAAKEAVSKALGTGIGDVGWQDIEILRAESGAPVLTLHGPARQLAAEMGLSNWSISLSHTRKHAVAMVVATSE